MRPAAFGFQTRHESELMNGILRTNEAAFDFDHVVKSARQNAGLDDFGPDPFEEPLRMLLKCAASEVRFKPAGLMNFEMSVQRWLVNRLRYVDATKRDPEILDEDVSDPIIILGMPRTGTTKLQRMMSANPTAISLPLWKVQNPAPFPDEVPGSPEGRIAFARAIQEAQLENNPEFLASHERAAEEAEEDSDLLLFALDYLMMYIITPSPTLLTWLRGRSSLNAYSFQAKLLQFLQWQEGGKKGRRWILKNPGHIGNLDSIAAVYPNATMVHLHRNLLDVVPSYCRLIESIHQELFEDVDPLWIGQDTLNYWGPEFKRQAAQRQSLADGVKLMDASYDSVVSDPLSIVEEAYELAGTPLPDDSKNAMIAWNEQNTQHKHGKPDYSMERYGLTEAAIEEAFGTLDR